MANHSPIGVFDSGIGGLSILKEIVKILPEYDYVYLGDNARAPYGPRSFETVYQYTWENVQKLFEMGCPLVILACNTSSAKALRTIQQVNLPKTDSKKRVLGVIRPTSETVGKFTKTNHIGILGTKGTVQSDSYKIEIQKFYPEIKIFQQACPMFVPLVENNEINTPATGYFVKKYLSALFAKSKKIDTIILGCTHYPLLKKVIMRNLPKGVRVISQGEIVAESLADYLLRHPEIKRKCSKGGKLEFYTTDSAIAFDKSAGFFWRNKIRSKHLAV